jgi:hypothetical protein
MSLLQHKNACSFIGFIALSFTACERAPPPARLPDAEAPAVHIEAGPDERPTNVAAAPTEKAGRQQRGQADAMRARAVELTLQAPAEDDASNIEVEVRVRNVSDKDILWDREFALPLYWLVLDDQGKPLDIVDVAPVDAVLPGVLSDRFLTLKPGEEAVKSITLTREVRDFEYSRSFGVTEDGDDFEVVEGHERVRRYVVPPSARKLRVSVGTYVDGDFSDAARYWLGFDTYGIFVNMDGIKSNTVEITISQEEP